MYSVTEHINNVDTNVTSVTTMSDTDTDNCRLSIRCTEDQRQYIKAERIRRGYDNIAAMVVDALDETRKNEW